MTGLISPVHSMGVALECLVQSRCTIRQRFDLIEFIYPCRRYANSRSAKFA